MEALRFMVESWRGRIAGKKLSRRWGCRRLGRGSGGKVRKIVLFWGAG